MVGGRLPRGSQLGFCQPFPRLGEWRTWGQSDVRQTRAQSQVNLDFSSIGG